jgi:hypothetical protein
VEGPDRAAVVGQPIESLRASVALAVGAEAIPFEVAAEQWRACIHDQVEVFDLRLAELMRQAIECQFARIVLSVGQARVLLARVVAGAVGRLAVAKLRREVDEAFAGERQADIARDGQRFTVVHFTLVAVVERENTIGCEHRLAVRLQQHAARFRHAVDRCV